MHSKLRPRFAQPQKAAPAAPLEAIRPGACGGASRVPPSRGLAWGRPAEGREVARRARTRPAGGTAVRMRTRRSSPSRSMGRAKLAPQRAELQLGSQRCAADGEVAIVRSQARLFER